jgi:hypothetical protein
MMRGESAVPELQNRLHALFNDEKMDVSSKNGKIVGDSEDMNG